MDASHVRRLLVVERRESLDMSVVLIGDNYLVTGSNRMHSRSPHPKPILQAAQSLVPTLARCNTSKVHGTRIYA